MPVIKLVTTNVRILATAPLLFFIPPAYIVVKEATQIGDAAKALSAKLAKEPKPQSFGKFVCNLSSPEGRGRKLPTKLGTAYNIPTCY